MRHLKRLPAPQILADKKEEWTQKFLESGKKRPDSSKYAHQHIRDTLAAMSFHKCFYCERSLKDSASEVDHYREVAEDPDLAFEWENLYLACPDCNHKFPNKSVPNAETLNPCVDTDGVIMQHITFEDEVIRPVNSSHQGRQTIRKYKLDSEQLDHIRRGHLIAFYQVLLQIQQNRLRDGGRAMNEKEQEVLNHFQQTEQPFSLMFKIYLSRHQLAG